LDNVEFFLAQGYLNIWAIRLLTWIGSCMRTLPKKIGVNGGF